MPAIRPTMVFPPGSAAQSFSQRYSGSSFFVLNANSKAASLDFDNPEEMEFSNESTGDNIRIIPATGFPRYLELYHLYTGNTIPSTQPILRVYGRVPMGQFSDLNRDFPSDVSSANFDPKPALWIPLEDASNNVFDITFSEQLVAQDVSAIGTPATAVRIGSITSGAVKTYAMSEPSRVVVAGAAEVMATVQTAAVGPTAGLILGRFTW